MHTRERGREREREREGGGEERERGGEKREREGGETRERGGEKREGGEERECEIMQGKKYSKILSKVVVHGLHIIVWKMSSIFILSYRDECC